jgi:acyl-CoA reductase-like NAD-dependent aldehyde dehydrogenase
MTPPFTARSYENVDAFQADLRHVCGPALPVIKYRDVEDAIVRANASENGLGGSVWSADIDRAREIARRMECGSVWVNKHGAIQPNAPFGDVKKSGLGVEFSEEGLQEYTDIQVVYS